MYAPSSVAQAAIPNPDQITQTLAKLEPDSALQQYASMHKNDPYIMSLAVAEANRRKALRAQPMQQQPTVVDQDIASMAPAPAPVPQQMPQQAMPPQQMAQQQRLPEQQGIGALPARNIENMADGGIAGYADGGVPGYAGGTLIGGRDDGFAARYARLLGLPYTPDDPLFQKQAEAARARLMESQKSAELAAAPDGVPPEPGDMGARDTSSQAAPPPPPPPPPATRSSKPPASAASPFPPGITGLPTDLSAPTPEQLIEARDKFKVDPTKTVDPFKAQRDEIVAAKQEVADKALSEYDAQQAARGDPYEKRSKRLEEREGRIGKLEGESSGLALLEAGLAIMGGTSQYAAANIGQGAQVGLKALKESKDKITLARERLDDAKDKIEDYKINYKDMTDKERRGLKKDINATIAEGKQYSLQGLMDTHNIDRAAAEKLAADFVAGQEAAKNRAEKLAQSRYEADSRLAAARIAAQQHPSADMQLITALRQDARDNKQPVPSIQEAFKIISGQRQAGAFARVDQQKYAALQKDEGYLRASREYSLETDPTKKMAALAQMQQKELAVLETIITEPPAGGGAKFLGFEQPK